MSNPCVLFLVLFIYLFLQFMTFVHLFSKLFKAAKYCLESMPSFFGEKETCIHAENTVLMDPDQEGSQKDSLLSQASYSTALKCRRSQVFRALTH